MEINRLIERNFSAEKSALPTSPPQKTRSRGAQIAVQLAMAVATREKKQRKGKNAEEILGEIGGASDDNDDQGVIPNNAQPGDHFESTPCPTGEDTSREAGEVKSLKDPVLDNILREIEGK